MKTNFPRAKTRLGVFRKIFGLLTILAAVLFLLWVSEKYERGVSFILRPVLKSSLFLKNSFASLQKSIENKNALTSELERLSFENASFKSEKLSLEEKLRIYEDLERFLEGNSSPGKISIILSQPPETPYDTILLDAGEDEGVAPGDKVVSYGILIGEITQVNKKISEVKLSSYPGHKIEGFIANLSLNVTLEGLGGYNMKFSVPRGIGVSVGDRILSNSRPSFILGQVEYIKEEPASPLEEVFVRIPLNPRQIRFAEIKP